MNTSVKDKKNVLINFLSISIYLSLRLIAEFCVNSYPKNKRTSSGKIRAYTQVLNTVINPTSDVELKGVIQFRYF